MLSGRSADDSALESVAAIARLHAGRGASSLAINFVEDEIEAVFRGARRERVLVLRVGATLFERLDDRFGGMMVAWLGVGRMGVGGQLLFHLLYRFRERALIGRMNFGFGKFRVFHFSWR